MCSFIHLHQSQPTKQTHAQEVRDVYPEMFFCCFYLKKKVKFRKPVVPGDTLVMEVEVKKFREKAAKNGETETPCVQ